MTHEDQTHPRGVPRNRVKRTSVSCTLLVMDCDTLASTFVDRGVVRLDGAFSREDAARIGEVVWRHLDRKLGVQRDDRSTWPSQAWLPISWKGLKRNRAFEALIESPSVRSALDEIFAPAGWQPPKPGAQVLFDLPQPGPWVMSDAWHMDSDFATPPWPMVKLFAFFGDVGPRGGGTMLLPGSHRLVEHYRTRFETPPGGGMGNWHKFLRAYPPLDRILSGARLPDGGRSLIGERFELDGVPVDVVELTGAPGDVVITDIQVFHCRSMNAGDTPRCMLGKAVRGASTSVG